VTIVAGHHGYATNKWNIGGTLRGKITDDDIDMLETISGSQGDRAKLYTRHPAAVDETCTPATAPQLVAIAAGSAANHATRPVGALTDPVVATWIVVDDATGLHGDRPHPRSS
jgi:hypothetical protein